MTNEERRIVSDEIRRATIRISSRFDARIMDIERHYERMDRPESFRRLAVALNTKVVPVLQRFPAIGRRVADSEQYGALHEFLFDRYILHYYLLENTVTFVSLRHTKETSWERDAFSGMEA
jgi:plasmid stabilization system protein ParE